MVIPNVTHIDGVPISQYDPDDYDPRKDTVVTVQPAAQATPAPAPTAVAAAPPPPVSAPTPAPVQAPAPVEAEVPEAVDDGGGLIDLLPDLPFPQVAPVPVPGGISTVALIDGREVEVALVDPATGGVPSAAEQAVVQVSGLGGQDVTGATQAYSDVCAVASDSISRWLGSGGRVTYRPASDAFIFWTSECPGLSRYVSG